MASADGNGAPASMKREGTMQRTVRVCPSYLGDIDRCTLKDIHQEAKEYSYGCKCSALDVEHDHDDETGQPVPKPGRQSTMEKTAQEGIQFLKDQRKDTLLEAQGLVPARANRNKGAAEADDDDEEGDDDEEEDSEHTGDVDDDDEPLTGENGHDDSNSGGPVKMAKHGTMLATAKEGHDLLENFMGGKPDPNARTRGQQKAHDDDSDEDEDEDDGPDAKRPRRTHTMQETAQAAQQFVSYPHSMGGTRSETAAVKKAEQASPKRQRKQ